MMETMIPQEVGMRLRTLKKRERPNKKREGPNKKREKNREGAMLLSFYHTCASK